MNNTLVDITIPVEAEAAAALTDPARREAVGRIISRLLHPSATDDPLLETMHRMASEARANGLTPEMLAAELDAHKRERNR